MTFKDYFKNKKVLQEKKKRKKKKKNFLKHHSWGYYGYGYPGMYGDSGSGAESSGGNE